VRAAAKLRGLFYFVGSDAGSANAQTAARAINQGMNSLQVQVPAALGNIVSVADPATELRAAATDFAYFSHKTKIS
jgi:hypothetical protein